MHDNWLKNLFLWAILLATGVHCHHKSQQQRAETSYEKKLTITAQTVDTVMLQSVQKNADNQEDSIDINLETIALEDVNHNLQTLGQTLKGKQPITMVCYGNSITNGYQVGSYATVDNPYPQVLQKLLSDSFRHDSIQIINEGHNGWRIDQALAQVNTLVLPKKPHWVIIEFGINDAYAGFSTEKFAQYYSQLIDILKQNHIAVILLTPTPILTPYHKKVLAYCPIIQQIAKNKHVNFINIHQKIVSRLSKTTILPKQFLPDGVHFADSYYAWIAEEIAHVIKK